MKDDTQKLIGKILDETAERDAIHVAVAPVIAGEDLWPGREVGFVYGSNEVVKSKSKDYGMDPIGIVDPFLDGRVEKGQRFFVFLFPGTVTGMRHHWNHPAFQTPKVASNASEKWLREFANKWNFDYKSMIDAAIEGDYVVAQGIDLHGADELDPGDEQLFWYHVGQVTGKEFSEEHKQNFGWSCSC